MLWGAFLGILIGAVYPRHVLRRRAFGVAVVLLVVFVLTGALEEPLRKCFLAATVAHIRHMSTQYFSVGLESVDWQHVFSWMSLLDYLVGWLCQIGTVVCLVVAYWPGWATIKRFGPMVRRNVSNIAHIEAGR